ncbi:pyridoxamine 5'-phosphate oxidase family protein [Paraburkholderia phymatum]|uniref:Pyridoxamine 5'-phosphate oxidase-related FMN-binding n=1 Tax=Paraburkholderia phymatum (strain DSM 17167 / CIP 108236 / LMG 21445 / STM815) TaxID=391038 RepID=B2JKC0_PARP8|nr:pyridoxamine 5'-phosphate oxidase family protein [Paraburkholderia phymatum]ACC69309.1 pyridoxamine 5'-phosphate oxidase-related FMN-binding [Paraburkholderia phymatum STM815]
MNIPAHAPLHLLHQAAIGTLATHARQPRGFPYPTVLPFAPDARHRPTILVSRLAEHTRNLHSDPRSGFLIVHAPDGDVLNGERVTLVGTFEHVQPTPEVTHRYLRYHPSAERYLVLGDFSFWVMSIERMRYIGGFGAMGWLMAEDLDPLAPVSFEEESALADMIERHPRRPAHVRLLGVDRYGADLVTSGSRKRVAFDTPAPDWESLRALLEDCIARQGPA